MKKIFYAIFIAFFLQIQVFSASNDSAMSKVMNSWMGCSIDEVIAVWGYPSSEKVIAGKKLYYWEEKGFYVSSNQYSVYGGETSCIRTLETDDNNIVKSWEWKGNDCPIMRFSTKKWVNPNNDPWQKEKMNRKNFRIFD